MISGERFTAQPAKQKKKLLLFKETQLLKGLTAKKAHADEIADIYHREFEEDKVFLS